MTEKMSFAKFQEMLSEELNIPVGQLKPKASFINDLNVDSLALASMILRLEEMGVNLPLESAWEIETIDDAYRAYLESQEKTRDSDLYDTVKPLPS